MKILIIISLLLNSVSSAEHIPPHAPRAGESKPSWWWDIWLGQVVVLEGNLTFNKSEEPDVRIHINNERIKDIIPDEQDRELQLIRSEYHVGELEVTKFHYADASISSDNSIIQKLRNGDLTRVKVLIPIMRFGDVMTLYGFKLKPDAANTGIHIFNSSDLILGVNLSYKSSIPTPRLEEAQDIFKRKEEHGPTGIRGFLLADRGYAGFRFKVEGDAVVVSGITTESPADKAGMKDGDVILSLNGKNLAAPVKELTEVFLSTISEWKPDDDVEIEVQRDGQSHKIAFKLLSGSDLEELIQSEQAASSNH